MQVDWLMTLRSASSILWYTVQAVIDLLYDTSLVTSGFTVDSPKAFADRIYDMIAEVTGSERFRSETPSSNEPVEAEVLDGDSSSDPWKQ